MNETATDEIRALEARAEKAEAELLKDRNEGECYGPFHAGFLCEDCANRYRWLRARVKDLEAGIWREQDEAIRQRDKAEAALAAALENADCANRYRWLRARVKELDAGIFAPVEHGSGCQNYFGHCLHEWKARAEKAEAELAAAEQRSRELSIALTNVAPSHDALMFKRAAGREIHSARNIPNRVGPKGGLVPAVEGGEPDVSPSEAAAKSAARSSTRIIENVDHQPNSRLRHSAENQECGT